MYLSVMDKKYFHVVFTFNPTLNSQKSKHILSNLQKKTSLKNIISKPEPSFSIFVKKMVHVFLKEQKD